MRKNKRDFSGSSGRKRNCLKSGSAPDLKSGTFGHSTAARVVNIYQGGALVETEKYLQQQDEIMLKLVASDGQIQLRGHILRSSISSLQGEPRYQFAVAFGRPYRRPVDISAETGKRRHKPSSASALADCGDAIPALQIPGNADDPAILTVITQAGVSLRDVFRLNGW